MSGGALWSRFHHPRDRHMSTTVLQEHASATPEATGRRLATLTLAALGIVYGDIGTSPLYAFKESIGGEHAVGVGAPEVLGVLSMMFWAVTLVVSLKYVLIVLRAGNDGEGGILALMALVSQRETTKRGARASGDTLRPATTNTRNTSTRSAMIRRERMAPCRLHCSRSVILNDSPARSSAVPDNHPE